MSCWSPWPAVEYSREEQGRSDYSRVDQSRSESSRAEQSRVEQNKHLFLARELETGFFVQFNLVHSEQPVCSVS